jgi:hypothetical protein
MTGPAVEPSAAVLPFRRPRRRIPLAQLIREEEEAKQAIGDAVIRGGNIKAAKDAWQRAVVLSCAAMCEETAHLNQFPPELVARWVDLGEQVKQGIAIDEPATMALLSETNERSAVFLRQCGYEPGP